MEPVGIEMRDIPLSAKFEYLDDLLQQQLKSEKKDDRLQHEQFALRLRLWAKDICGNSQTQDETASQVLQVVCDTQSDSALTKAINSRFDEIISIVETPQKDRDQSDDR